MYSSEILPCMQIIKSKARLKEQHYCSFNILRKDVLRWAFYSKWFFFVLIDHILSETFCILCFYAMFSNA